MTVLNDQFIPSKAEAEKAKNFKDNLKGKIRKSDKITIQREGSKESIRVPKEVFGVLMKVLSVMSEGKPFSLIPLDKELTTQQAADMLNISRPHASKLMDVGEIPHRKVGRNRRVKFRDLLDYQEKQRQVSLDALQELADQSQKLGMGY